MFKPLSIKTKFRFSIRRDGITGIINTFDGGMFEDLDITYGNAKYNNSKCSVTYTLSTTIQSVSIKNLTPDYVFKMEKRFKDKFFKRVSKVKNQIVDEIKITTEMVFIDKVNLTKKELKNLDN